MSIKKVDPIIQSLVRIQQIKEGLLQTDLGQKKDLDALEKSGKATELEILKLKNIYLEERVTLYNETAQIENDLLNTNAKLPKTTPEEILALAKRLNLADLFRKQHSDLVNNPSGWCLTSCEVCIKCTECVISGRCTAGNSPIGLTSV